MCRALIIGAGGVGTVVTQKIAANPIFTDVMLASRIKSKCDAVLPYPKSLGANYTGQTSIGCRIRGIEDGKERTYYIYNNCDHEQAFK